MRTIAPSLVAGILVASSAGTASLYAATTLLKPASASQAGAEAPTLERADVLMRLAQSHQRPDGTLDPREVMRAYDTLQAWRRSGDTPTRAASEFERVILPIYRAAADATYALNQDEDTRVQALLALGEAERINQIEVLADGCSPASTPFATKDLKDNETIFYPIVGRERVYLMTGRKPEKRSKGQMPDSGWKLQLVEGEASKVVDAAATFFAKFKVEAEEALPSKTSVGDWGAPEAAALYDLLLRPVIPGGADAPYDGKGSAPVLIVSPDPLLRNVPWAALRSSNAEPGQAGYAESFVVAHYAVATVPALGFVRPTVTHRGAVLATGSDRDPRGIEDCSKTNPEGDSLQSFVCELGSGKLGEHAKLGPVGAAFTADALESRLRLGGFSALLIAEHAHFDTNQPYIEMPDGGQLTIAKLGAAVTEKRLRDYRFDLLIFVSCESAQSDLANLGLAGAAVRSGASTIFGTLVEVPRGYPQSHLVAESQTDLVVGKPMVRATPRFLEAYSQGLGAAEALRRVQYFFLKTQQGQRTDRGLAQLDEPVAWASYQIVGWWR